MKILSLRKVVTNIQKCLIPDTEYLKKNYGRHCLVDVPGSSSSLLVRIGLCEPKQITGAVFIDSSVSVFQSSDRVKQSVEFRDVDYQNFCVLPVVRTAVTVHVKLIFVDVTHLINQKCQPDRLTRVVREILKLYVVTRNSVIYLDNLSEAQRSNIYCIDIQCIDGESFDSEMRTFNCTDATEIVLTECISRKKYEMCNARQQIKLGGLNHIYKILKDIVEFSKNYDKIGQCVKFNNKILLTGPPGCGKTSIVNSVASNCQTVLLEVLLPEICSSLPGETEKKLEAVFERAKIHADSGENCIILIEDIDVLCGKRKDDATSILKRCVTRLISLLEEFDNCCGVVIIATTSCLDDVDVGLRRAKRFDDELEIVTPSEEDRVEIINHVLDHFGVNCSKEVINNFAMWTPGFVGADLHLALQETLMLYYKTKGDFKIWDKLILEDCFKRTIPNITATSLRGTVGLHMTKDIDFSAIGGLEEIKKLLDFSVKKQLLHPEVFERLGVPLTKGILLYGPPGCAKTTLVKALAKESNMTFLAVSSADLYSSFVGDPEKKILQLFSQARISAPAIVFIDEIDGLIGSKSGDRVRGVQERVLSTLLVEMDGVGVRTSTLKQSPLKSLSKGDSDKGNRGGGIIVIGATNRPERLDDALRRPGRFDKIVYVPPPSESERLNILKKLTEKMPLSDDVDLGVFARITEFYSGADLKNLCYESALLALTDSGMSATTVDRCHFEKVLARTRPSLTYEMIGFYESFRDNLC